MRLAQTSIEASLVITFMMLVLVAFMGVFAQKTLETKGSKNVEGLEQVAGIIKREVLLADRVQPGYVRNFTLPIRAGDFVYNITLINSTILGKNYSEIVITANESEDLVSTVVSLPANLNGELCVGLNLTNVLEKRNKAIRAYCLET